jgi:hypothetical protein
MESTSIAKPSERKHIRAKRWFGQGVPSLPRIGPDRRENQINNAPSANCIQCNIIAGNDASGEVFWPPPRLAARNPPVYD